MAIVLNAQFRPFSYGELVAPLQDYAKAYKETEDAYSTLAMQTEQWKNLIDKTQSPEAYAMYSKYVNALNNTIDDFSRGMTLQNRSQLLGLRKKYASDIKPIEVAYAAKQKQADQQMQALLQDPTMMFSRIASNTSLDDYVKNPQLSYNNYSGKLATAQVAQAASALAKQIKDNPRKWYSILGGQAYETLVQKGFSSNDVLQAVQNNPKAAPELLNIVEDAVNSSGIKAWNNEAMTKRIYDYARQGLWNAIGETQYQTMDNKDYMTPLQKLQYQKMLQEMQTKEENDVAVNPLPLYSSREMENLEATYKDNFDKYAKYFYTDKHGQIRMNNKGWAEYNRKKFVANSYASAPGTINGGDSIVEVPSDFRTFMDSIGGKNVKGWQPGNFGNLWGAYNKKYKTSYRFDATKVTEYDYKIDSSQEKNAKRAVITAMTNGVNRPIVDYDPKTKTFVDTGKTISKEVLNDKDTKLVATRYSPYGSTAIFLDKDGNHYRVRLPEGISQNQDKERAETQWMKVLQANRKGGTFTIPDDYARANNIPIGTKFTATAAQIQQEYATALKKAQMYHSNIFSTNTVEPQKFKTYSE